MSKSTPEGVVKDAIKKCLQDYKIINASDVCKKRDYSNGWYYMPVQVGMGVKSIPDFVGCYLGGFFAIEAKAPGKKPTDLQAAQLDLIQSGGGNAFAVDGAESLERFIQWLEYL